MPHHLASKSKPKPVMPQIKEITPKDDPSQTEGSPNRQLLKQQ